MSEFYKKLYLISQKIPKKDRYGIYLKIEKICLEIIDLTIIAALERKNNKLSGLNSLRIKIEVLKKFIRLIRELDIINNQKYFDLESDLQEMSEMTNGWIKYLKSNF